MKTPLGFLLVLLLVVLAANVQAGTIILKSGEKYENVEYRIDKTYDVVKVDLVGTTRNFSFHQIDAILDSNGNDKTLDAHGTVGARLREIWNSEQDEDVKQARARLWDASISPGGRYNVPMGDFYGGIVSGIGFGADVAFTVTHIIAIRIMIHQTGMEVDDVYAGTRHLVNFIYVSQNPSISEWGYQIAGQYYGYFDREKNDRSMYYIYGGLGALSHHFRSETTIRNSRPEWTQTSKAEDTQTNFTTSFGGGIIKMLSPQFGIDIGLHFDVVHLGSDPNTEFLYLGSDKDYAYRLDLRVGLVALL